MTNRRTTAERVVPASARTILATASHEIRARVHTPSSGERLVHMLVHMALGKNEAYHVVVIDADLPHAGRVFRA